MTTEQEIFAALARQHCVRRYYEGKWYPLCWNWKMHQLDLDYKDVFTSMVKQHFINEADAATSIRSLPQLERTYHALCNAWCESVLEDMCRSFIEDDTMRYVRPVIAEKYHVDDGPFDVKYDVLGRSGGWLSLSHFEGEALTRILTSPEYNVFELENHASLPKLCAMVEEITLVVDSRFDEYLTLFADQLFLAAEAQYASV